MLHNICTIELKYYVIHDMLLSRFWVRDVRETSEIQVKFTILPSLTSSRGKYLRVVGIHSDGLIEREISLVYSVSHHFAPSSARNAVVAAGKKARIAFFSSGHYRICLIS